MAEDTPTQTDRAILDLLRCEPPSHHFDYFRYGGLPRTVFKQLQKLGSLDDIIDSNNGRTVNFPCLGEANHSHTVMYRIGENYSCIMANNFNQFSNYSDAKLVATTAFKGHDSQEMQATLIGLETYRREDKHPLWEIGFYITKKGNSKIIYGEQTVVEVLDSSKRPDMYGKFFELAERLHCIEYLSGEEGTVDSPEELKVLKPITRGNEEITTMPKPDFDRVAPKRFRYLAGTQDVIRKLKLDDGFGYEAETFRRYRVELIGSEEGSPNERYLVLVLATNESEEESIKSPEPNGKFILFGPYSNQIQAEEKYASLCKHYVHHIHINAGLEHVPFNFDPCSTGRELKYITIAPDKSHKRIAVTSWESPDGGDSDIDEGKKYHFIKLYSGLPQPLPIREGCDFQYNPRKFMGKLLRTISEVEYKDGKPLLEEARRRGILLKPSA